MNDLYVALNLERQTYREIFQKYYISVGHKNFTYCFLGFPFVVPSEVYI